MKNYLVIALLFVCGIAFADLTLDQEIQLLKNDRDMAQARLDAAQWKAESSAAPIAQTNTEVPVIKEQVIETPVEVDTSIYPTTDNTIYN